MEWLADYGLFLAKVATVALAIIVIMILGVALGSRNNQRSPKGRLVITKLNERFDSLADVLRSQVLSPKAAKHLLKSKRKAAKAARKSAHSEDKKRLFVLDFEGDMKASATQDMREAITAVLNVATPQDEVVLRLESPGGMVHGYGLAASQLARITARGIALTVCVDKVAASGGYMMACVANRIVAAPFAIIGSIGVVAQIPNIHRLLRKHEIDVELLTAGEYKRTLTVLGENTERGRQKFQQDLEETHELFKDFIAEHRTSVNIDQVATGEIWYGTRALGINLVDEVATSDEYLLRQYPAADIFLVAYEHRRSLQEKLGVAAAASIEGALSRMLTRLNSRFWGNF